MVLSANGSVTYTPNASMNGQDSFTYRVDAAAPRPGRSARSTSPSHRSTTPLWRNDTYSTAPGSALVVDVANGFLGNDTDIDDPHHPDRRACRQCPRQGQPGANPDGSFTYTPYANASGRTRSPTAPPTAGRRAMWAR